MAEKQPCYVQFWGVRGSIACPQATMLRYGGNTSCVEINCGGEPLIFDAGSGIKSLGDTFPMDKALELNIFLSHTHLDHINGFPFFRPAYNKNNKIRMWAGHLLPQHNTREVMEQMMQQPFFPVSVGILSAWMEFIDFKAGNIIEPHDDIVIKTAPLNHPNGATGYRVEYQGRSICYVTDTEHVPGKMDEHILQLVEGADVFIYDSTYTDEEYPNYVGWGHSTWQEGMKLADKAGVKQFVIFHHDPSHDDTFMDKVAREAAEARPNGVMVAQEGHKIEL